MSETYRKTHQNRQSADWLVDADGKPVGLIGPEGRVYQPVVAETGPGGVVVFDPAVESAIVDLGSGGGTSYANQKSVRSFGVVGDGVADDTLALIAAFEWCIAANVHLVLDCPVRFVAGTVPAGKKLSGPGVGFYVSASSMVGAMSGALIVEGVVGFSLDLVDASIVGGFKVTTSGGELTPAGNRSTIARVFFGTAIKRSARFYDLEIDNQVSATDGTRRARTAIDMKNAKAFYLDNVAVRNATGAVFVYDAEVVQVRWLHTTNTETGLLCVRVGDYSISNIFHTNTKAQQLTWIGKEAVPPRGFNGMDAVIVEGGNSGIIDGVKTVWAIERSLYVQSSNINITNCDSLNVENVKAIGVDRNNVSKNIHITNCHLTLDEDYELRPGRAQISAVTTYYSENVMISDCTAVNRAVPSRALRNFFSNGFEDHTTKNVVIRNCVADRAETFVWNALSTRTTAELLLVDPAQTFVLLDGLLVEGCTFIKEGERMQGALLTHYDTPASSDAKLTYSVKNVTLRNNTVVFPTATGNDYFLFDIRYCTDVTTENNNVNFPFYNTWVKNTITDPYANITMKEGALVSAIGPEALTTYLGNLSLKQGSWLKFRRISASGLISDYHVAVYVDGPASGGRKTVTLQGKGYYNWASAVSCVIEMVADGAYYVGKVVNEVKTDQVGTPPIGVTPGATSLQIRGDQGGIKEYYAKLTVF